MPKQRTNFRDRHGHGAFPNETPLRVGVQSSLRSFLSGDPVPYPPVVGPVTLALDISKWQEDIDFDVMAERVQAVWIKADQGLWTDDRFEQNARDALDAGLEVGFYHFADPAQSCSPEQAAVHCHNLTSGLGHLSVWLDAERAGRFIGDPNGLLNYYIRWCDKFRTLQPDRKIDIYTRMSFWNSSVARSSYWMDNGVNLNAARYHLGLQSPWSDGRYTPRDWNFALNEFHLWQYSADGNGLGAWFGCQSGSVDLNLFSGDWAAFEQYYGLTGTPEPPEPPIGETQKYARILVDGLRFRADTNTNAPIYFTKPAGYEFRVLEEIPSGSDVWLKTGVDQYCARVYRGTEYCEVFER